MTVNSLCRACKAKATTSCLASVTSEDKKLAAMTQNGSSGLMSTSPLATLTLFFMYR